MNKSDEKPELSAEAPQANEPNGPLDEPTQERLSAVADSMIEGLGLIFQAAECEMLWSGNRHDHFGSSWQTSVDRLSKWREGEHNLTPQDFEFGLSHDSNGSTLASLRNIPEILAKIENPVRRHELALSLSSIAKNFCERLSKERSSCDRLEERISNLQRQISTLETEFGRVSASPENGKGKKNPFRLETLFDSITSKRNETELNRAHLKEKLKVLESLEAELRVIVEKFSLLCTDFDSPLPASVENHSEAQGVPKRSQKDIPIPFSSRILKVLQSQRSLPLTSKKEDSILSDEPDDKVAESNGAQLKKAVEIFGSQLIVVIFRNKVSVLFLMGLLGLNLGQFVWKKVSDSKSPSATCDPISPKRKEAFDQAKKQVIELAKKEKLAEGWDFPGFGSLEVLIEKTKTQAELDGLMQILVGTLTLKFDSDKTKSPLVLSPLYEKMLKIIYGLGDEAELSLFFVSSRPLTNPLIGSDYNDANFCDPENKFYVQVKRKPSDIAEPLTQFSMPKSYKEFCAEVNELAKSKQKARK